jgi:predicted nucleic acid-binding protein
LSPLRWTSGPPRAASVAGELRLCLDLNVWCAAILGRAGGRSGTASQLLTDTVAEGKCALGPTRLIVSWPMLTRLETVLVRDLHLTRPDARQQLAIIAAAASADPAGGPYVVLGGSGLVPLHDDEDGRVLEAAVAGRADVVATGNMSDFVSYRSEVVVPGRVVLHRVADHEVVVAHPAEVARWVRTGEMTVG